MISNHLLDAFFGRHTGFLKFNHSKRNPVDEQDQIRTTRLEVLGCGVSQNRKLFGNVEYVVLRIVEINEVDVEGFFGSIQQLFIIRGPEYQHIRNLLIGGHQSFIEGDIQVLYGLADVFVGKQIVVAFVGKTIHLLELRRQNVCE